MNENSENCTFTKIQQSEKGYLIQLIRKILSKCIVFDSRKKKKQNQKFHFNLELFFVSIYMENSENHFSFLAVQLTGYISMAQL